MKLRIRITIPWWVVLYGKALMMFATTFGLEPDVEKYSKLIKRFSKYEVISCDGKI